MDRRRRGSSSQNYRDAVLATNPIAYWRLGERSGTVARDEMGAHDGTYVNAPTLGVAGLLAGDPDTSVTLDGTSQYIAVPDSPSLQLGTAWTLGFLIQTTGGAARLISKRGVAAAYYEIQSIGVGGQFQVVLSDGSTSGTPYTVTTTLNDGAIHRVFFVRDGVNSFFVIDGVAEAQQNHGVAGSTAGNDPLGIGAWQDGTFGWLDGTFDEPAIWDRALSAAEVAALYAVGMGR